MIINTIFALTSVITIAFAAVAPVATDKYIISHSNGGVGSVAIASLENVVKESGSNVEKKFDNAIVATLTKQQMIALEKQGIRVEKDTLATLHASQTNPPSWGLDRINQRIKALDNTYAFSDKGGAGVNVYVIDTGILTTHEQFIPNRATFAVNYVGDGINTDCSGHGTHVAGTIGGNTHGIARNVKLIGVKVFGCSGGSPWSVIMSGIQYVIDQHKASSNKKTIINMSLGGGKLTAVDDLVKSAVANGILVVVSAGNDAADACNSSPANVPVAITVAASDINDAQASFSNWGPCVDLYAPGVGITSSVSGSNNAYSIYSGTSMASPHVAGVAALYWGMSNYTPTTLTNKIITMVTKNAITNPTAGTQNRLLYQDTFFDCTYKIGTKDNKTHYCVMVAGANGAAVTKCGNMGGSLADVSTASEFLHLGTYVRADSWVKSYGGTTIPGSCMYQVPKNAVVATSDCTSSKTGVCEVTY